MARSLLIGNFVRDAELLDSQEAKEELNQIKDNLDSDNVVRIYRTGLNAFHSGAVRGDFFGGSHFRYFELDPKIIKSDYGVITGIFRDPLRDPRKYQKKLGRRLRRAGITPRFEMDLRSRNIVKIYPIFDGVVITDLSDDYLVAAQQEVLLNLLSRHFGQDHVRRTRIYCNEQTRDFAQAVRSGALDAIGQEDFSLFRLNKAQSASLRQLIGDCSIDMLLEEEFEKQRDRMDMPAFHIGEPVERVGDYERICTNFMLDEKFDAVYVPRIKEIGELQGAQRAFIDGTLPTLDEKSLRILDSVARHEKNSDQLQDMFMTYVIAGDVQRAHSIIDYSSDLQAHQKMAALFSVLVDEIGHKSRESLRALSKKSRLFGVGEILMDQKEFQYGFSGDFLRPRTAVSPADRVKQIGKISYDRSYIRSILYLMARAKRSRLFADAFTGEGYSLLDQRVEGLRKGLVRWFEQAYEETGTAGERTEVSKRALFYSDSLEDRLHWQLALRRNGFMQLREKQRVGEYLANLETLATASFGMALNYLSAEKQDAFTRWIKKHNSEVEGLLSFSGRIDNRRYSYLLGHLVRMYEETARSVEHANANEEVIRTENIVMNEYLDFLLSQKSSQWAFDELRGNYEKAVMNHDRLVQAKSHDRKEYLDALDEQLKFMISVYERAQDRFRASVAGIKSAKRTLTDFAELRGVGTQLGHKDFLEDIAYSIGVRAVSYGLESGNADKIREAIDYLKECSPNSSTREKVHEYLFFAYVSLGDRESAVDVLGQIKDPKRSFFQEIVKYEFGNAITPISIASMGHQLARIYFQASSMRRQDQAKLQEI